MRQRRLGALIVVIAALLIGVLTLTPGTGTGTVHPLWCLSCVSLGSRAGTDLLLNTLLFVPYAFGLWHSGLSARRTMAVVAATTVGIELLQTTIIPGRYASLGDIVANIVGGVAGLALGPRWPGLVVPGRVAALRLATLAAVCWLALVGAGAYGMQPALPSAPYTVSWQPAQLPDRRLTGQVLAAQANGVPLPPGRRPATDPLVRRLRDRRARFDAVLLANGRSNERDSRIDIAADDGTRLVSLGQDDRDLLFSIRLNARNLRLRAPSVRGVNALPSKTDVRRTATSFHGDTIRITGELLGNRMRMSAAVKGAWMQEELALGPELGWTLFLPYPAGIPNAVLTLIGALWLGLPLVPLGYWGARCGVRGTVERGMRSFGVRRIVAPGLLLGIGLGVIPLSFGSAPVSWAGWLVGGASIMIGWALGRTSTRLGVSPGVHMSTRAVGVAVTSAR